jgi:16S rRNA (guanine527-N7)-methyltransferase
MKIPPSFLEACEQQDIHLTPDQGEVLRRYVEEVMEVNRRMNLTSVREADQVWMRHIFDSLLVGPWLKADPNQRALDLGSGGGFPGMVMAIMRPDMEWTLVDSVGKKARFLKETAEKLGLSNVQVDSRRAEELGRDPAFREQFQVVTARAVARLNVLMELTIPLLKPSGHLLAMKGEKAPEEMKEARRAAEALHVRLVKQEPQIGGGHLLDYRKQAPTAGRFPRAIGVPGKEPL